LPDAQIVSRTIQQKTLGYEVLDAIGNWSWTILPDNPKTGYVFRNPQTHVLMSVCDAFQLFLHVNLRRRKEKMSNLQSFNLLL
jgi:hypothetical protein